MPINLRERQDVVIWAFGLSLKSVTGNVTLFQTVFMESLVLRRFCTVTVWVTVDVTVLQFEVPKVG
jgi:hypothetical protein